MAYVRKRRPIKHKLTFNDAALNFTFACNLACVGCDRASFIKPEHSPPMTKERLGRFFEEVKSTGLELKRMRIVGGEPTLHPDFFEMTKMCMEYSRGVGHRCNVRIFSNHHTQETRDILIEVKKRHPRLQMMGGHKRKRAVFPRATRYEYVSPLDAGMVCNDPCPNMGSRRKCGNGVDEVGYSLCPTAGPIDAILGLGARATTLKQMLDREFVDWQAKEICGRCGNFMAYADDEFPELWDCNGTPVSKTYRDALVSSGFEVKKK